MFKSFYLFIVVSISFFIVNPLYAAPQSQFSFESDGVIVCGDGSHSFIIIKKNLAGNMTYRNNGSSYYRTGYALARAVGCPFDYKIYDTFIYFDFIDCNPSGNLSNGGSLVWEVESSPTTTITLPDEIFIIQVGYPTGGVFPTLEAYYDTKPDNYCPSIELGGPEGFLK